MRTLKEMIKEYEPKIVEICTKYNDCEYVLTDRNTYEYIEDNKYIINSKLLERIVTWYSCCGERLVVKL